MSVSMCTLPYNPNWFSANAALLSKYREEWICYLTELQRTRLVENCFKTLNIMNSVSCALIP